MPGGEIMADRTKNEPIAEADASPRNGSDASSKGIVIVSSQDKMDVIEPDDLSPSQFKVEFTEADSSFRSPDNEKISSNKETRMEEAALKVLEHAMAGWIRTVRRDETHWGYNLDTAIEFATNFREFWKPFESEKNTVIGLIRRGYLQSLNPNITVGITLFGLAALKDSNYMGRLEKEFSKDDIDNAEKALLAYYETTIVRLISNSTKEVSI
jgi:hypothetical protein